MIGNYSRSPITFISQFHWFVWYVSAKIFKIMSSWKRTDGGYAYTESRCAVVPDFRYCLVNHVSIPYSISIFQYSLFQYSIFYFNIKYQFCGTSWVTTSALENETAAHKKRKYAESEISVLHLDYNIV